MWHKVILNRKQLLGAAALLAALTVLVYCPAMRAGFIWDDGDMVTNNPLIKSPRGLADIWRGGKLVEYHPLTYSVFWLEWRCWGMNPAGYHVVGILLHAANTVLLWLALRKLRIPGSWLAALLFGLHPVCAASVAWIAELKNTLSMFFYLAALLCWLRSEEGEPARLAHEGMLPASSPSPPHTCGGEGRGEEVFHSLDNPFMSQPWEPANRRNYALALLFFLLALLAKVSVVVLPVVLLLLAWWRHGRISRRDLARTAPFFCLALALGLFGMTFQNKYNALNDNLPARLIGGTWAFWFYLWKIFWPVHLTIVYPRWDIHAASPAAWIPGICLAAMLLVFWRRRSGWARPLLFGTGYFLIALAPVLGVFKLVYLYFSQVGDHLQYLAVPGIVTLAVAGGWQWLDRSKFARPVIGAAVAAALAVLTWQNQSRFASMSSMWRDNLVQNPNSYLALLYVGAEEEGRGHYDLAGSLFQRALAIRPKSSEATLNLGIVYDDQGRPDDAIAQAQKALQIKTDDPEAHLLMARFLEKKGLLEDAARHLQEAARFAPDDVRPRLNLGNLLVKQGRLDDAVRQYGEALKLKFDDPAIFVAMGNAQGRRGDMDAALACFQKALSLDPNNADARRGLAAVRQAHPATNAPAGPLEQAK